MSGFRASLTALAIAGALVGCSGGASSPAPEPVGASAASTPSPSPGGSGPSPGASASAGATVSHGPTASASPAANSSPNAGGSGSGAPTASATATATATGGAGGTTPVPSAAPSPSPTAGNQIATCIAGPNPITTSLVRNPVRLRPYSVDPNKVFVAGISSGGFFGVQMHVAHSKTFKGAAIYAGGVYYCAQDNVGLALAECGGETLPNCQAAYQSTLGTSESYLDAQSLGGTIDPASNLAGQPVYLWSGTNDQVVNPTEMNDLSSEYRRYGANVTYENTYPANHGWESPDGEVPCPSATEPYMVSCPGANGAPYDSVKTWLTKLLGPLNPRATGALAGSLINFDQTEFGASPAISLDTNGWVYVPQACASGATCGFVLALHGCIQNQAVIGTKFITEAGINEWADTNNLIVLYPYAVESSSVTAYNPMGCWDWWGYVDSAYSTKGGAQVSAVYKMVQRITGLSN